MADSHLLNTTSPLDFFSNSGWPPVSIITGRLTFSKNKTIEGHIARQLFENQEPQRYDAKATAQMVEKNEHPDYYLFGDAPVKIGERKNPDPGTVRHLIDHVLSYSPRNGKKRFIYFKNAAKIQNEAESALLKSLEESQPHTHFILSVESPAQLKETIVSRSMVAHLPFVPDPQKISNDPWERFWYLSQWSDTTIFNIMDERGWVESLKEFYAALAFRPADYAIFEDMGWNRFRELFAKDDADLKTAVMRINFLPLYFSIRDALAEGSSPAMGPISLPGVTPGAAREADGEGDIEKREGVSRKRKLLAAMAAAHETYFQRLSTRYFGTRPPDQNLLFFLFLNDLMKYWRELQ